MASVMDRPIVSILVIGFLSLLVAVVTFTVTGAVAQISGFETSLGTVQLGGGIAAFVAAFYLMHRSYMQQMTAAGMQSSLDRLDDAAREAFLQGGTARTLGGRWKVRWFEGPIPADLAYDGDQSKQQERWSHVPEAEINIRTYRSRVMGTGFNKALGKPYWLEGRISNEGVITLHYWAPLEEGWASLTGVLFLKVLGEFDANRTTYTKKMKGWWMGYVGVGKTKTRGGLVELEQISGRRPPKSRSASRARPQAEKSEDQVVALEFQDNGPLVEKSETASSTKGTPP